MADVLFNFAPLADINPYTDGSLVKPTGAIDGKIVSGRFVSSSTTNAIMLYTGAPVPSANEITLNVVSGEFTGDASASRGHAIMALNGDGYFTLIRSNDLRVYKTTAGGGANTLTQIGSTISLTAADSDDWLFGYNIVTGAIRVLQNGVSRFTATDTTHIFTSGSIDPAKVAALRLGICSRAGLGRLRSATFHGINVYTVTSINGGSPITASQTSLAAILTGFSVPVTTITATYTGGSLAISGIGGATNAPTFTKPARVDGVAFPKSGTTVTFAFSVGAESASGTQVVNKDDAETALVVASPVLDNARYLFGAILADTGRTAANTDEVYYTVPVGMSDLTIATNGEIDVTNAGTFTMWMWTAATGVYYYYDVTITESGVVIGGGLTSAGLTVSGLTSAGLTSAGL